MEKVDRGIIWATRASQLNGLCDRARSVAQYAAGDFTSWEWTADVLDAAQRLVDTLTPLAERAEKNARKHGIAVGKGCAQHCAKDIAMMRQGWRERA